MSILTKIVLLVLLNYELVSAKDTMNCPKQQIPKCYCMQHSYIFRGPYVHCSDLIGVDDLDQVVQVLKGNPVDGLQLDNVSLPYLPRTGLFQNMYVQTLWLSNSDFTSLAPTEQKGSSPFAGLEDSLEEVKIDGLENLQSMDWSELSGMKKLTRIEVYRATIGTIDASFSTLPPSFKALDLLSGGVTSIAPGAFALKNASSISVSRNTLPRLDGNIFGSEPLNITSIRFSLNHVKEISDDFFTQLPALNLVDIGRNELTRLPSSLRNQWTQIESIYLAGNNFACNCDLVWLLTAAKQHPPKYHDLQFVTCESPPSLKGKNLLSLQETDMCP